MMDQQALDARPTAAQFTDAGSDVKVTLQLPEGVSREDVSISGGADHLRLRRSGDAAAAPLLSVVQLYSTVEPEHTRCDVEDGRLTVTLRKRDASVAWPGLEAEEASSEPSPSQEQKGAPEGAGAALQERDRVRELLKAAQDGNLDALKAAAVHFGGNLGAVRDGNGRGALHFAAQLAQLPMVSFLLEGAGVDVNAVDDHGETALSLAAGSGMVDTMALLLMHGADPNPRQQNAPGPLHRAAATGNADAVKALVEAGADTEAPSEAGTPLLWAAGSSATPAVQALLEVGASASAVSGDNISALFMATVTGSDEIVGLLLAAGADVNAAVAGGATPLHGAAGAGSLPLVLDLLQAGADTEARDGSGARPIDAAAEAGTREVVETLLPLSKPPPGWQGEWSAVALMDACAPAEQPDAPSPSEEIVVPQPQQPNAAAAADAKLEGDVAFRAGLFEAAVRAYSKSLAGATDNARVWANRSAAHLAAGDAAAALQDARAARTVDPAYAKAWYREGSAAKALAQWEAAAQAFFEAYRVEPTNEKVAQAFQEAVRSGQQAHAAAQAGGS